MDERRELLTLLLFLTLFALLAIFAIAQPA
jgi:hypothetical protein